MSIYDILGFKKLTWIQHHIYLWAHLGSWRAGQKGRAILGRWMKPLQISHFGYSSRMVLTLIRRPPKEGSWPITTSSLPQKNGSPSKNRANLQELDEDSSQKEYNHIWPLSVRDPSSSKDLTTLRFFMDNPSRKRPACSGRLPSARDLCPKKPINGSV